jgi:hypothetical protein
MTYMGLHFGVRLLIVGIALSYVLAPMLRHWRTSLARSDAVTVRY